MKTSKSLLTLGLMGGILAASTFAIPWPSPPTGEPSGGKLGSIITPDLTNNRIGINNSNPQETLDITGSLKVSQGVIIGNDTVGVAGKMRFTGTQFEWYDGSVWTEFGLGGGAYDEDPDAFNFTDVTGAEVGTLITSDSVTLTGFEIGTATVSGDGSPEVSCDGGTWGSTCTVYDSVQVRLTSSASYETANTATVTVGTTSDAWSVTTGVAYAGPVECGTSTDADGNVYGSVQIGSQCWADRNLNVGVKLASGSTEPNTGDTTIQKWCYDNSDANCGTDGGLYNWTEATKDGYAGTNGTDICPTGWHMPTDAEYYTLENYLATGTCSATRTVWECDPAGTALKDGGASGYDGLLTGFRKTDGSFYFRGSREYMWSSTESGTSAWRRFLYSGRTTVDRGAIVKGYGSSIRCLKD